MLQQRIDAELLLGGSRTSTGTILTVPAGMQWNGSIQLTASIAVGGTCAPVVTTAGTDVSPAAGSVVHRLSLSGLALSTVSEAGTIEVQLRAPEGNDVTLEFTAGANGTSTVVANGYLTP